MFILDFTNASVQRAQQKVKRVKPDVMVIENGKYSISGSQPDTFYEVQIWINETQGTVEVECNCISIYPCYHGVAGGLQYIDDNISQYEREQIQNA
jgi:hypothetical protein